MPPPSFAKQAFPVFTEQTTSIREFDPELADYLETIKGSKLRKVLISAVEGTANCETADPADIQLVGTFLGNCFAWYNRQAEVNWICARGAFKGPGNLRALRASGTYIRIFGCDGNEAFIGRYPKLFRPRADFSKHLERLNALRQLYASDPITVTIIGYSVLGVFVKPECRGYKQFEDVMEEIAQTLLSETGKEYVTNYSESGIRLELADKMGRRSAILRIRAEEEQDVVLEIYGGNSEKDIEAQREVNSQPHGFSYKVFSSRDELMGDAAWGPNKLDYISGLIDGPEQWSRFVRMIAAAF